MQRRDGPEAWIGQRIRSDYGPPRQETKGNDGKAMLSAGCEDEVVRMHRSERPRQPFGQQLPFVAATLIAAGNAGRSRDRLTQPAAAGGPQRANSPGPPAC